MKIATTKNRIENDTIPFHWNLPILQQWRVKQLIAQSRSAEDLYSDLRKIPIGSSEANYLQR